MKKTKKGKEWHASSAKTGMGDYYGQAIKNPQAKIVDNSMGYKSMNPKSLSVPPRSLA